MKIYFLQLDGYNAIAFNEGKRWKVLNPDKKGKFDGKIDLYKGHATDELKNYFETNYINDFENIPSEEYNHVRLISDYDRQLIFITEI